VATKARAITLALAVIGLSVVESRASAARIDATYSSCAKLRKVWPYGVAIDTAKARIQPVRPRVNRSVYQANRRLDTNRDGTVCEIAIQKQPTLATSPIKATTTVPTPISTIATTVPPTTTSTIPTRPTGTWKIRWMGQAGDSAKDSSGKVLGGPGVNVVYGEQAEVVICEASGDLPAKLEVKENGTWRTAANGFKSEGDTTRCADASRPIGFSFYWMVDTLGIKRYRSSGAAYYASDLELRMTTSVRTATYARYVGTIEDARLMDLAITLECSFSGRTNC